MVHADEEIADENFVLAWNRRLNVLKLQDRRPPGCRIVTAFMVQALLVVSVLLGLSYFLKKSKE